MTLKLIIKVVKFLILSGQNCVIFGQLEHISLKSDCQVAVLELWVNYEGHYLYIGPEPREEAPR